MKARQNPITSFRRREATLGATGVVAINGIQGDSRHARKRRTAFPISQGASSKFEIKPHQGKSSHANDQRDGLANCRKRPPASLLPGGAGLWPARSGVSPERPLKAPFWRDCPSRHSDQPNSRVEDAAGNNQRAENGSPQRPFQPNQTRSRQGDAHAESATGQIVPQVAVRASWLRDNGLT